MQTAAERIVSLRAAMKNTGVQAYIIPSADPHLSEYSPAHWEARKYFSGFTGSAGTLVVTQNKSGLWTDGRYFIQAEQQLKGSGIALYRMGVKGVPSYIQFVHDELSRGETVSFDGRLFSAKDVNNMKNLFSEKDIEIKQADLVSSLWENRPPVPHTKVFLHNAKFAGRTCAEKVNDVRTELKKHKADGQIFARLDCVAWLMNIRADDVLDSPFALAYAAVFQNAAYLFIDSSRVPVEVAENLKENGVTLRGYNEITDFLSSIAKRVTVLADPEGVSYAIYSTLEQNANVTVKNGPDIVTDLKSIKNGTEIKGIHNAHLRDGCAMVEAYTKLEKMLSSGKPVTEWTVCELLKDARAHQSGNHGVSFETIAAYRANAAMMHYEPTAEHNSKLEKEGFLLVDSGGQYTDGTTDITRTYALGPVTHEEAESYTWVLKCHIALATAVFLEGCTGGNIDIICREPLWKHYIDYRCGTGHGVGMFGSVHEGPQNLRCSNNVVFHKGMTMTNEPGVYVDGKFGIRTENLMVV
ncbi:MAG TPA: peptidase M24, partial [Ruminococcaceae bacterium]|nr:peptidase M24 [Oscillospiraceae bacterium]